MKSKTIWKPLSLAVALSMGIIHAQNQDQTPQTAAKKAQGGQGHAEQAIQNWKAKPKEVAQTLLSKYGQPDEVTSQRLIWHNNGPWKKTEVVNEEIPHSFPMAHTDIVEQTIALKVPPEKFDELAQYDGSVIVERTKGEISARCDKEEMNYLAINLAKDIVDGKKSVEEARDFYATTAMAFKQGQKAPYTQKLQFQSTQVATADPDQPAGKEKATGSPGGSEAGEGGKKK